MKDLNLRPQTIKPLQENIGETLQDIDVGKDFLNSRSTGNKNKNGQVRLHQLKKFLHSNINTQRMRKKRLANHTSSKGLVSKYIQKVQESPHQ